MSLDTGPFYPDSKDILSKDYAYKMQQERFEIFKSQDPDNGHFDITFEIEGKKLYANKFILTPCSETLKAMISDRWSNKDESVKIEAYSYDNFYQFLTFLYTGSCMLSPENVLQLTDMAEFYAVPFLKEFCEKFLLGMNYYVQNIEEMFEFAQKYSMKHMEDLIKKFVSSNFEEIISSESLLSYKKPFMDVLASIIHYPWKEKTFEAIYKWVEHQVIAQKDVEDESFNLLETVKTEFREKFPQIYSIDKTGFNYDFLLNFIIVKGFRISPTEFQTLYETYGFCGGERFQRLWRLAEKQAIEMEKITHDQSFSVVDFIKADLVSFIIPNSEYYKMDKKFLMESLVPAGILTKEQASHVHDTRVTIENNGKAIAGIFDDKIGVLRRIRNGSCNDKRKNTTIARFLKFIFRIPSSPSTITKMKGVDWYLCLDKDGVITLKHHSVIHQSDYILAEMKSQTEFFLTSDVRTNLTVSYNDVEPML